MRHCVDPAGREKVGCVLSRESVSSCEYSAFSLPAGNWCFLLWPALQDFWFSYPIFPMILAPRRTGKGNMEHLMSLITEAIQSFFYCCNFYCYFMCLLEEIQWPVKSFDDVPGCC